MSAHVCSPETQRLVKVTEVPSGADVSLLGKAVYRRYCTECPAQEFVFEDGTLVPHVIVGPLLRSWS